MNMEGEACLDDINKLQNLFNHCDLRNFFLAI